MRPLTVRAHEQDGAISVMAAGLMLAMLLATALAVDVGRVASVSRDQQGITDRAALDAVWRIGKSGAMNLTDLYGQVEATVVESIGRNPGSTRTAEQEEIVAIFLGSMQGGQFTPVCGEAKHGPDPDAPPPPPTCPDADLAGVARHAVTAVWVATESVVPYVFGIGGDADDESGIVGRRMRKVSVAETQEIASVTVGSQLASFDGGILDDLFSRMLCPGDDVDDGPACTLSVGIAGYEELAGTTVALGPLLTELGAGLGAPDQVLSTVVSWQGLLTAMVDALDDEGSPATLVLEGMLEESEEVPTDLEVPLLDILDIRTSTAGAAAEAEVHPFDLLMGFAQAATAARVADGTNFIAVPGADLALAHVTNVSTRLGVIEAPRTAIGPAGQVRLNPGEEPAVYQWATRATTSQVQLAAEATIDLAHSGTGLLSQIAGTLGGLIGALTGVSVTSSSAVLPLSLDLAAAEAALTGIECRDREDPSQSSTGVTAAVSSDAARLVIGTGDGGFAEVGRIRIQRSSLLLPNIDTTLIVRARGDVSVGGAAPADPETPFLGPYPSERHELSGHPISTPSSDLEVQIVAEGSGLDSSTVNALVADLTPTVRGLLAEVADGLGGEAFQPVLDQLGVGVGNAHTWVNSVNCQYRRLAPISLD